MPVQVLDLFAGSGGLSLGLTQAGLDVVAAVEVDRWAGDTFQRNHPKAELLRDDIQDLASTQLRRRFRGEADVVVGGPPCQGFSVSGSRQYGRSNPKNALVHEFVRVVDAVRPKVLLLENVGGFRTARINESTPVVPLLRQALGDLGYDTQVAVLQAADYGVPQYRSRLFLVGSQEPLPASFFPEKTHAPSRSRGLKQHVSVSAAISDLPPIQARQGADGPQDYTRGPRTQLQRYLRDGSGAVWNHQAMNHTPRLVDRFSKIEPGGSGYEIGRKRRDIAAKPVTVYKMNNQRLVADLPSLCITANFQSNFIHPVLNRNLTAREAARVMTFPDTFVFCGRRTLMSSSLLKAEGRHAENHLSQYNQIGNAVPPLLAKVIGARIGELLVARLKSFGRCAGGAGRPHA